MLARCYHMDTIRIVVFVVEIAAYAAGMWQMGNEDQLLLALEPEAAAIHCQHVRLTIAN
jgi:hypothetical protein